jgi:hypothetical protein
MQSYKFVFVSLRRILRLFFHLRFGFPSALLASCFLTKTLLILSYEAPHFFQSSRLPVLTICQPMFVVYGEKRNVTPMQKNK